MQPCNPEVLEEKEFGSGKNLENQAWTLTRNRFRISRKRKVFSKSFAAVSFYLEDVPNKLSIGIIIYILPKTPGIPSKFLWKLAWTLEPIQESQGNPCKTSTCFFPAGQAWLQGWLRDELSWAGNSGRIQLNSLPLRRFNNKPKKFLNSSSDKEVKAKICQNEQSKNIFLRFALFLIGGYELAYFFRSDQKCYTS